MTTPNRPSIDVEALRTGLRAAQFNDQFEACEYTFIGQFSNNVWRLDLDNGIQLVVKAPYRGPRPGEDPDMERRFYREMAQHPELPIPRFVGEFNGALVLEFSEVYEFSFKKSVGELHADAAMDALADWHARFWGCPPQVPWLPSLSDTNTRRTIQHNYDLAWSRHSERLLHYAPQFAPIGEAMVGRLTETLALMTEPATLIHGDAHAENVVLTNDGALLLDWQHPHVANPGLDLAVFITMSLHEEQRAERERYLVNRHSERVKAHGCDWPDPWRDYQLGLLRRAARIVEIADSNFVSLPWVFRRTALAAVEHWVGDLIR